MLFYAAAFFYLLSTALKDADKASRLQAQAAENAKERYEYLQKLQVLYGDN